MRGPWHADDDECDAIRRVLRRLPLRDPLCRLVETAVERKRPPEGPGALLQELVTPVGYGQWRRPYLAAWALGRVPLTPDEAAEATRLLVRILHHGPPLRWSGRAYVGLWRGLLALGAWILNGLAIAITSGFGYERMPLRDNNATHQVRAAAAAALGRLGAPESVGPLAAAASRATDRWLIAAPQVPDAAERALEAVLPSLVGADRTRLAPGDVDSLCRLLSCDRPGLRLPVIEALRQVGDARAIPTLERLARQSPGIPVREAAETALQVLRERQRREQEAARLLRPADRPAVDPATLLRPGVDPTAQEVLLRPAGEGDAGERAVR